MTDIQFYHLTSAPLERVLPRLLEKSLAGGFKVVVRFATEEQAEVMSIYLWTHNPDSFLPTGTKKDGRTAQQLVYLTATDENPNKATLLIVTDGSEMQYNHGITRLLDIVDANDQAALAGAQARMDKYRGAGLNVSCVRQSASGGWEKLAA